MVSVEVVPDQVAHLLEGSVSVSWARGILTVDTPAHRVIYNGKTLDVVNKAIEQCSPLSSSAVERLSNEKAMCASSLSSPRQVCFSKEMLPECDIGFIASETMVQEAGFVCLPA